MEPPHTPPIDDLRAEHKAAGAELVEAEGGPVLDSLPRSSSDSASRSSGSLSKAYTIQTPDDAALLREKLAAANERLADLEGFYMTCATQPGGILDRRLLITGPSMAMAGVSDSSVLWTSTPFAASLTKRWMRMGLVVFAFIFALFGYQGSVVTSYCGTVDFRMYRFTNLEMRHQPHGTEPSHHHVGEIGLLRKGCRLDHSQATVTSKGPEMTIVFPEGGAQTCGIHGGREATQSASSSDGWYFKTRGKGSPDQDPVKFKFEGSDDGVEWTLVGASSWCRGHDGRPFYAPRGASFPTPSSRGVSSVFDMRTHWTWLLAEAVLPWGDAVVMLTTALLAFRNRAHHARNTVVYGTLFTALIHAIACIGSFAAQQHSPPLMHSHVFLVCARVCMSVSVAFERVPFAIWSDLFVVAHLVISAYYKPITDYANVIFGGLAFSWAVAGYTALANHHETLKQARELVEPDRILYDKVWDEIVSDPGEVDALEELRSVVNRTDHSIGPPRQLNRQRAPSQLSQAHSCRILDTISCQEPGSSTHFGILGLLCELVFGKSDEDANLEDPKSPPTTSPYSASSGQFGVLPTTITPTSSASSISLNHMDSVGSASGGSFSGSNSRILPRDDSFATTSSSGLSGGMDHFTPFQSGGGVHGLGLRAKTLPGTVDRNRPVKSLDQLFTQAVGMDAKLRTKVQQWALDSEGMFPVGMPDGTSVLMQWEHVCHDECTLSSVKWGKLKKGKRAIEKLLRSHRGDVSLLVDVCRQCIVFESSTQLLRCLKAIAADKDVVVERIKNRLHPDYNTKISAGYRDCLVNLRIVTDDTCRMGIEGHVCEVQLLLRKYWELKSEEGHKRYVVFRNFRGE
mmetsp:Transcript_23383/g.58666  ORF Transcript_23383/g.58666 Transcript_23383/m.58666 type:complete len:854 (-) Transcript_23383:39-2600(-)